MFSFLIGTASFFNYRQTMAAAAGEQWVVAAHFRCSRNPPRPPPPRGNFIQETVQACGRPVRVCVDLYL